MGGEGMGFKEKWREDIKGGSEKPIKWGGLNEADFKLIGSDLNWEKCCTLYQSHKPIQHLPFF